MLQEVVNDPHSLSMLKIHGRFLTHQLLLPQALAGQIPVIMTLHQPSTSLYVDAQEGRTNLRAPS